MSRLVVATAMAAGFSTFTAPADAVLAPPGLNVNAMRDVPPGGVAYTVRCEVFLMPDHLFPHRFIPITVDIDRCYETGAGGVDAGSSGMSGAYITKAAPGVGTPKGSVCAEGSAEWLDATAIPPTVMRASMTVCK